MPASGTSMRKKERVGPAPSVREAPTNCWSTEPNPAMAWRTKNGMATNACAMTTAIHVNGSRMPRACELVPEQAHAAEGGEERDAGDGRRQDERQLEDGGEHVAAGEAPGPEQVRDRRADDDDEGERDQARLRC